LLDPSFGEGHRYHGLPYPATLVLSPEGVVEAKLFLEEVLGQDGSYRYRIDPADALATIDALE
jgi:hypothetical protein